MYHDHRDKERQYVSGIVSKIAYNRLVSMAMRINMSVFDMVGLAVEEYIDRNYKRQG